MRRTLLIVLALFVLLAHAPRGQAYNRYAQNPADLNLMESVFVNPALNPYLRDKVSLAGTFYHPGLTGRFNGVSGGMIGYHLPSLARGAAVGVQFLNAGLYSETTFRAGYGYALTPEWSFGGALDITTLDYDQEEFYRFNHADPLIASGNYSVGVGLGLGVYWRPNERFRAGLSIDNVNRPNIGMVDSDRGFEERRHINLGVMYRIGDWWTVRAAGVNLGNNAFTSAGETSAGTEVLDHTEIGIGRVIGNGSEVRLTVGSRAFWAGLEFPMTENWYFNYRYDYPFSDINAVSNGTHRFGVVYDVYRRPELPQPTELPELPVREAKDVEWPLPSPRGQIHVYTPRDELAVRHVHSLASLTMELGPVQRANLRPRDFGDESEVRLREDLPDLPGGKVIRSRPPAGMYSPEYLGSMESMTYYLANEKVEAEIVSPQRAANRARGIEQVITGGGYQLQRDIPIVSEFGSGVRSDEIDSLTAGQEVALEDKLVGQMPFYVVKPFTDDFSGPWRFLIRDLGQDQIIFDIGSPGEMPDEIIWTGRLEDGRVLPAGVYEYVFTYQKPDGEYKLGGQGRVNVVHHQVYRDIQIQDDFDGGDSNATRFELILHPRRR